MSRVLISTGERGWLKAERVQELFDGLKADGRDVTLKIFTSEETAAAQDMPTTRRWPMSSFSTGSRHVSELNAH